MSEYIRYLSIFEPFEYMLIIMFISMIIVGVIVLFLYLLGEPVIAGLLGFTGMLFMPILVNAFMPEFCLEPLNNTATYQLFLDAHSEDISQLKGYKEKLSLYDSFLEENLPSLREELLIEIANTEAKISELSDTLYEFENSPLETGGTLTYHLYVKGDTTKKLRESKSTLRKLQERLEEIDKRLSEIS